MNPWKDSEAYAREAAKVDSVGEALLLTLLWWRRDGWTVRAQEPVEQYRVDLFVPEARVAIEVDSFAAHSTGKDQQRDAAKRNLVVARGWAPFTFTAQEAVFFPHNRLVDVVALIGSRLPPKKDRPNPPRKPLPPDMRAFAAGSRALLDALAVGAADSIEEVRLSASLREMANATPRERAGVALFRIVMESPAMIHDPLIYQALSSVDGPVALAAVELAAAVDKASGTLDEPRFLPRCPALLQPVALRQLRDWASDPDTAWSRAFEAVNHLAPDVAQAYRQSRVDEMMAALRASMPADPAPPAPRRRA